MDWRIPLTTANIMTSRLRSFGGNLALVRQLQAGGATENQQGSRWKKDIVRVAGFWCGWGFVIFLHRPTSVLVLGLALLVLCSLGHIRIVG